MRLVKATAASLVSGPRGLNNLMLARRARHSARETLQQTLALLEQAGHSPEHRQARGRSLAALKDELLDHPVAVKMLGACTAKG
jgi:hypothetical protein